MKMEVYYGAESEHQVKKNKNKNNHLIPSALPLSKRDQMMQTRALLLPLQQLQNERNSDS